MKHYIFHSPASSVRVTVAAAIEGSFASFGVSRCSKKDQFVKKIGRERALIRAQSDPVIKVRLPKKYIGSWFVTTARGLALTMIVNPELVSTKTVAL